MTILRMPMLLSYGALGLPLAMVALPIYVYLPQFYAERAGLSLALIGAVLLTARVAAAFIDPLLGAWIARGKGAYARYIALSLAPLLLGFAALFHPPALGQAGALAWFLATLMLVYLGFGIATIAHQSWGAALTQDVRERSRVTGVREACGLAGVVLVAAVTGLAGYSAMTMLFGAALAVGAALLLARAPRPALALDVPVAGWRAMAAPFAQARFRSLFAVLVMNGVASAIPATLFLFFVADHLGLASMSGLFLIIYFGAAAVSIPGWVALAVRHGEARAWAGGMLLACAVFIWAFVLPPGAALAFGAICVLSGLAVGADLALPPALLAGVIAKAGHAGAREAAYFGIWNWGVQITLALAAGIALPLLEWLGFVPGTGAGTGALVAAYALLPCTLKLAAAALLWRAPLRDL
ncbi:MFS transporter [Massilia sp. PAMC28688]|uniref:MFS transporter n=1 Tax=Massilia sp. PAMC28688 TaxID=2861283 RepID=UPI001C625825|nr:MFS transporter [Massilia sp. PAMC28688]QYF94394.1 MFS transporter [Massilia sp. PAMC28688]